MPAAVKAAILKEVGDDRLVDIGRFGDGADARYEIEMVVDGKEFDVLFSADGKVLKKTFEGLKPGPAGGRPQRAASADGFQDAFDLEHRRFSTSGRSAYFILQPGYQLVLEGKDGARTVQLQVLVTDETKQIGDVETRVVEERESVDG